MAARPRAILAELLARRGPAPRHRAFAVGHAHIDTAWVWPMAETRRKLVRTAANQLALIDRYPGYRFAASSAQHYAWLEEDDPELFSRVLEAVAAGRWEVVGGSWVEPDCNLPERRVAGPPAPLRPALVRGALRPPLHDLLEPRHLRPQRSDAADPAPVRDRALRDPEALLEPVHPAAARHLRVGAGSTARRCSPTCRRSAPTTPSSSPPSCGARWPRFRDHDRSDASLILFGHGDGGGGPTPEMLESAARVTDLRGLPLVERSTAERFFDAVAERADELATIAGQLYFEYHRGTYTSQAQTKLGNRAGERALHEAEAAAAIAGPAGSPRIRPRSSPRCGPCCCATSSTTSSRAPRSREVHEPRRPSSARSVRPATELRDAATAALAAASPGTVRRSTSTRSSAATCSRRRRAGSRCTRARRSASARGRAGERGPGRARRAISSGSTTASCPLELDARAR